MLKSKCCGKEAKWIEGTPPDYFYCVGCMKKCEVVEEHRNCLIKGCGICDKTAQKLLVKPQPPTESWETIVLEVWSLKDPVYGEENKRRLERLRASISRLLSQAEARHREEIIKLIEGMKKTRKPTHGPCCTCQECGYCNESGTECECARNKVLDEVIKYLKE